MAWESIEEYFDAKYPGERDRPELEAVADVVREVIDNEGGCASGGWREGEVFLRLAAALDALDARRRTRDDIQVGTLI